MKGFDLGSGFSTKQHDHCGATLWKINLDLTHIYNILVLSYGTTRHGDLFRAIGKVNDGLYALRCELDRRACWETNGFTDYYFRNFREDSPYLNDSILSGCSPEEFKKFQERINLLWATRTTPDHISIEDHAIIAEALRIANQKVQTASLALSDLYFPDERPLELAKTVRDEIYNLRKVLVFKLLAETPADKEKRMKSLHLYFQKGIGITRRAT